MNRRGYVLVILHAKEKLFNIYHMYTKQLFASFTTLEEAEAYVEKWKKDNPKKEKNK
jgi:hypothetical protein